MVKFSSKIRDVIQTLPQKSKGYTPKECPNSLFQNNVKRVSHVDWMLNLPTLLSEENLKVWTSLSIRIFSEYIEVIKDTVIDAEMRKY